MLLLSYPLSEDTPFYGNSQIVSIKQSRSIVAGDSANTLDMHFSNHSGTHIDAPYHFDDTGKRVTDYEPSFWFCRKVVSIESSKISAPKTQLGISQFEEAWKNSKLSSTNEKFHASRDSSRVEVLLWKTGWCNKRMAQVDSEKTAYSMTGPSISAQLANYLRETFPSLRFFGFDLISLSSFADREEGRRSHRAFLCDQRPILPIEDMDLRYLPVGLSALKNLLISPLFIDSADGAPVTAWGNLI